MLVEDTIADAIAVPDDHEQWLHRVSGHNSRATPIHQMSECGFDLDDDKVKIRFVAPTQKRKELPEPSAVQLPAKRPRSQQQPVVPQLVMVPPAAAAHQPTEFFRKWVVQIQNHNRDNTSGKAFLIHVKTVPLAFQPLDDSNCIVTYVEVVNKIKEFRALLTASSSTVLTDLHCAYVGAALEEKFG